MITESAKSVLSWSVGYLEVEDEPSLAMLLGDCELQVWTERDEMLALVDKLHAEYFPITVAVLTIPGDLYAEAEQHFGRLGGAIQEALSGRLDRFHVQAGPAREWSNQAADFDRSDAPRVWKGMRFRSYSEQVIAEALDRGCLDFQPNCLLRSGEVLDDRSNIEPDFVIYAHGRIGVLEADGLPFHRPENAAAEHERDRRLRSKGWIVERFDAEDCRNFPDDVVARFLQVLRARR